MAYDEKLAERIREALAPRDDIQERKMFGGIAFLRAGRMFVGITGDDLMVRVGPERYQEAVAKPHVRPMDFTGRPLKGYVYVAPAGRRTAASLRAWVELGAAFVATLPPGAPARRRKAHPKGPRQRVGPEPRRRRRRSRTASVGAASRARWRWRSASSECPARRCRSPSTASHR
jgi:TfoX/Sxy family transcriptional regulator of competence genes